MSTADHCRAMADEADRLASIVAYARDKVRLRQQAETWRAKAAACEVQAAPSVKPEGANAVFSWLRRRCA